MVGYKLTERKMFYVFNLDERVPQDHILKRISKVVDSSFILATLCVPTTATRERLRSTLS